MSYSFSNKPSGETLFQHKPCCVPQTESKDDFDGCGSSDAMCGYYYQDNLKKRFKLHCFSCNKSTYLTNEELENSEARKYVFSKIIERDKSLSNNNLKEDKPNTMINPNQSFMPSTEFLVGKPRAFRGVTNETQEKYGAFTKIIRVPIGNGNFEEKISKQVYPYTDKDGNVIAQKVRIVTDEQGKDVKEFAALGDKGAWNRITLFGQNAFPAGSARYLTITEGELDAMSAFQMLGSKYPVVSISNGAHSIRKMLENKVVYDYVDSFENIIVSFDADEHGSKAAEVFCDIFPGKTKVMPMSLKDANEYLMAGKGTDYVNHFWKAQAYRPDGLALSSEFIESVVSGTVARGAVVYPYKELNRKLFGMRKGELTTWTAGTSVGKSAIIREIAKYLYDTVPEDQRIGMLMLEESPEKTVTGLVGIHMNKPLLLWDLDQQLPEELRILKGMDIKKEDRRQAAQEILGGDRFVIMKNSFQSNDIEKIIQKVRQMNKVYGCQYIFLDHLSIIVSGQDNGDERKALDEVTTKLRRLVEETGICLHVVSHLRRPQGKGHEEGAEISISDLRGTAGIGQLSDNVIGLERNQQHEDDFIRNVTTMRVLKCRVTGLTGIAGHVYYNIQSGRIEAISNEEYEAKSLEFQEKQKRKEQATSQSRNNFPEFSTNNVDM
jgi:twinkle protein